MAKKKNVPQIAKGNLTVNYVAGSGETQLIAHWDKCTYIRAKIVKGKKEKKNGKVVEIETVDKLHYKWYAYYHTTSGAERKELAGEGDLTAGQTSTQTSISANSFKMSIEVKPISKKYTTNSKGKTKSYWTGKAQTATKNFNATEVTPSAPTVSLKQTKLTVSMTNLADDVSKARFQIYKNYETLLKDVSVDVTNNHAEYEFDVEDGIICTAIVKLTFKGGAVSEWSDHSSEQATRPTSVDGFKDDTPSAESATSVYLSWDEVLTAESYEVNYVTKLSHFDTTQGTTATTEETSIILEGLELGNEYYFRIRAVQGSFKSEWYPSDYSNPETVPHIVLGRPPAAPSTYSLISTVKLGDIARLYWVHNAQDNSTQVGALLEFRVNGISTGYRYVRNPNYTSEFDKDKNVYFEIDTSESFEMMSTPPDSEDVTYDMITDLSGGAVIEWRVRTKGVTGEYGDWSAFRKLTITAPPTLVLKVATDNLGWIWDLLQFDTGTIYTTPMAPSEHVYDVDRLPIFIKFESGPQNQNPIGYRLEVTSNDNYEIEDVTGDTKQVVVGQVLYSKYIPSESHEEYTTLGPTDMDFEAGASYTITGTVTMDTGLTAEASFAIRIDWEEFDIYPMASIGIDLTNMTAVITPECRDASNDIDYGDPDEDGEWTVIDDEDEIGELVEDVVLDVYRKNSDGSYTLVQGGIANTQRTITDPHPTLDYVIYRIVAHKIHTGQVIWDDTDAIDVNQPGIVINWDEETTDIEEEAEGDEDYEGPRSYTGTILFLPYNVDVSESHAPDSALIEYIGRSHPVGYYGTQLGETFTWKTSVVKQEFEGEVPYPNGNDNLPNGTLFMLRQLSRYTGDVYVREAQSRLGFWANVKVSFDFAHKDKLIPVTLTITRVEGGA